MFQLARRSILVLLTGSMVVACGSAGAASPTIGQAATDRLTAAPSSQTPVSAVPTLVATPAETPFASVTEDLLPADPMAPAHVVASFDATAEPTGAGARIQLALTASDPRASGTGIFDLVADEQGTFAWQWGDFQLTNDGGTWKGSCQGAGWESGVRAEVSCWLRGDGAYDGLTYYQHISVNQRISVDRPTGEVQGVILPVDAPSW